MSDDTMKQIERALKQAVPRRQKLMTWFAEKRAWLLEEGQEHRLPVLGVWFGAALLSAAAWCFAFGWIGTVWLACGTGLVFTGVAILIAVALTMLIVDELG